MNPSLKPSWGPLAFQYCLYDVSRVGFLYRISRFGPARSTRLARLRVAEIFNSVPSIIAKKSSKAASPKRRTSLLKNLRPRRMPCLIHLFRIAFSRSLKLRKQLHIFNRSHNQFGSDFKYLMIARSSLATELLTRSKHWRPGLSQFDRKHPKSTYPNWLHETLSASVQKECSTIL
jgi:hypothetical protein